MDLETSNSRRGRPRLPHDGASITSCSRQGSHTATMERVRRLDPEDGDELAAVLELTQRSFDYMHDLIDPPSSVVLLTIEGLASGPGEVWVVGVPPIATVTMTPRPDVLYIGKLAVDEAARGQGLARGLIDKALQRASELGLAWIELQTRIELTKNHRTFEAMGFVEFERTSHPGYTQPTSITYRLEVPR